MKQLSAEFIQNGSKENRSSINQFLRESYSSAKKQIRDGIDAFRDELLGLAETAESWFSLPVNNHLKDLSQIDRDFQQSPEPAGGTTRNLISLHEAITTVRGIEENY
jgi:hypothetical protein